ncbi:DNA repair protein, partial [Halomonas sp. 707D4]|nr:DNA repair protein [Halomonas sp. 707D4]
VRDRADIFESGGNVIRLGPRHRFSVNQQHLDLTLVPRDERLMLHLTGTQYFEPLIDERLTALSDYWSMSLPSESRRVYRAEYLAYRFMETLTRPEAAPVNVEDVDALQRQIATFASPRYREGYEKGIHDHDAALIVRTLWPARQSAGLLGFGPLPRALAMLFWANLKQDDEAARNLRARCLSAGILSRIMQSEDLLTALIEEIAPALEAFVQGHKLPGTAGQQASAAEFLVRRLAEEGDAFPVTRYADALVESFTTTMQRQGHYGHFEEALAVVQGQPGARWTITSHWLTAHARQAGHEDALHFLPEAIAMLNTAGRLETRAQSVELAFTVEGLLGQHERLDQQRLALSLDDFQ